MLTINNFLDEQLFQEIKLSYPSLSFFESHGNKWQGNNRYNISYINDNPVVQNLFSSRPWSDFFKKINSINFKNYLFKNLQKEIDLYCDKKIFNFEFSTAKDFNKLFFIIDIAISGKDYYLDYHVDARNKIINGIFYINDSDFSTDFNHTKVFAKENKAVFWVNHDQSFHKVSKIVDNIERKFIFFGLTLYSDEIIWK